MSTNSANSGSSSTLRNSGPPANDEINDHADDEANGLSDFGEASAIQGNSFALVMARSIGALVAVVAITLGIFILLGCRMTLALIISKIGLLGLSK